MRFERRGFGGGRRFGGGGRGGGFREGGFRERDDMPKPVKVGEEYDVEISEVGSKGDGIARVNNFVVFVNGVKQGDKTRIKITDVRNRFAIGEKVGGESAETTEEATEEVAEESSEESGETEETKEDASEEEA